MCKRCPLLEEEIERLRYELAWPTTERRLKLMQRLKLTTDQAEMLLMLYAANGRPITRDVFEARMHRDWNTRVSDQHIHHIRLKIGKNVIGSARDNGHWITSAGKALVDKALA